MTDNEIKSALKCAILNAKGYGSKVWSIEVYKLENTLDLINRLKEKIEKLLYRNARLDVENNELQLEIKSCNAEIERLNALVKTKNKLIEGLDQSISYAYDRAIKEFAERLKNEIINDTAYACDSTQHSGYYDYQIKIGDTPEYIDNLVKEMVGDDNA